MPVVWIPPALRHLSGQQETVRVPGATIGAVIDQLEQRFPGLRERLCVGSALRPGLAAVVDSQVARGGLGETVQDDSEVHFVPAIGGGETENLEKSARNNLHLR